ncbi:hypothetical protein RI054_13g65920 [Pseudoscourfieldia marina]
MAFPTLFPDGKGDYFDDRGTFGDVGFAEYLEHLLHLRDGRFRRNKVFILVTHNIYMRQRVRAEAGYFVRKQLGDDAPVDARAAIDALRTGNDASQAMVHQGSQGLPNPRDL